MVCNPDGLIIANLWEKTDTYYVQTIYREEVEKRHQTMKWLDGTSGFVYRLAENI